MLLELVFNYTHCKPCCIYGYIEFMQNIRKSTDMVLMSVGDYKALYLVDILLKISNVRNNKVDSKHVIIRE